ncbi:ATP-binding cassette domain-containing protein [Bosea caraganae]|uniref:ATP-binding cassette domain-containing protein n=1 Tax=Bosea caraganae TaxID=2763117 RepID=A0A370LA49_9HYPH|nr:ATP-binding cassette domain-containing protein [Bosea caraganae]RDJ21897.1 ATP-binding cassette domain-containing protein [Bosea caraganae]RDJ28071.1 ATP-binding cassette domain-containing protein [Bosea caraganae]
MTLRVDTIQAGYGDRSIVGGISFEIAPGQIMALFGHNGAGKSTTLRALLGLIPISEGSIWLDGQRIDGLSVSDRIERGLRLLPEGRGVFPDLTIEENLAVVAAANRNAGASGITPAEIYDLFPILVEKRRALAGGMSGGQQQMLAFGLALLGSPRCVLLEEPSVGLQPDLVEQLFAHFRQICTERQISAILIEHKITSALKIVDDVLILNNGRPVFHESCDVTRNTDIWKYF